MNQTRLIQPEDAGRTSPGKVIHLSFHIPAAFTPDSHPQLLRLCAVSHARLPLAIIRTAKEIVEMLQNTDDEMKHKIEQLLAQIGIAQYEYQPLALS